MILFPILYIGARIWKRQSPLRAEAMDFYTGIAEIEAEDVDEPPPKNKLEAFWAWLVRARVEGLYDPKMLTALLQM